MSNGDPHCAMSLEEKGRIAGDDETDAGAERLGAVPGDDAGDASREGGREREEGSSVPTPRRDLLPRSREGLGAGPSIFKYFWRR